MRLVGIWRYPVKSLQGERIAGCAVEADGLHGDRRWGIRDETTGKVLTARRAPQLLFASAALTPDGEPVLTLPTGETCHGTGAATDSALSAWLGKPVRLVASSDIPPARAEFFEDPTDDTSAAIEWTMPAGRFVDAFPLLVLTTATLRAAQALHPSGRWDVQRFRPNLLVEADGDRWEEDEWYGRSYLGIGDALLRPQEGCIRCTMVTRPQPGVDDDRDVFRTLARHHGARFGAWTDVVTSGIVAAGDDVRVQPATVVPPARVGEDYGVRSSTSATR